MAITRQVRQGGVAGEQLRRLLGSTRAIGSLLALCSILLYHPLISLPPVQDDWGIFGTLFSEGVWDGLISGMTPQGGLFYRPLPWPLFGLQYSLFRDDLACFHVAMILAHAATGTMIFLILTRLTGSRAVALASALLTVAAASVSLEPLAWMVGIYDIGGAFLATLSFHLFLKGRIRASCLAFLLAALTKEATLFLPFLLWGAARGLPLPPGRSGRVLCHFVVAGVIILGRAAPAFWGLPPGSAYALQFAPAPLGASLLRYLGWGLQGILPIPLGSALLPAAVPIGAVLLSSALLAAVLRVHPRGRRVRNGRVIALLAGWTILALAPALPLADHPFRYYITYALPPLASIAVIGLRELAFLRPFPGAGLLLPGILPAGALIAGFLHVQGAVGAGLFQNAFPGENRIPGKGAEVLLVRETLRSLHGNLPPGSRLAFEGIDTPVFGGATGPRIWYGDPSITVETWGGSGGGSPTDGPALSSLKDRPCFLFVMEMKGTETTGRLIEQPVDFPAELP
jgi:hypothetical protein